MSESYLGEIRLFAGQFVPRDWAPCDGHLLAISGNEALFSLLGTNYGGDGRATFGLPDFRGRIPVSFGEGPGLTERKLGSRGGSATASLSIEQIPAHRHVFQGTDTPASSTNPVNAMFAKVDGVFYEPQHEGDNVNQFSPSAVGQTGENVPHENRMASLALNYIISLKGDFPPRN